MVRNDAMFVLVKWVDEELWDVLPMKSCVNNIEKIEDVVGTVVDFYWKRGEESAPSTVLDGKEKDMEKRRKEQLEVAKPTDEQQQPGPSSVLGDGQRTIKKPARLHAIDDAISRDIATVFQELPAKKKKTQTATTHSILKNLQSSQQKNDEEMPCRCNRYDTLKEKYASLKIQKRSLQQQVEELMQYKEIHTILDKLKEYQQQHVNMSAAAPRAPLPATSCDGLDTSVSSVFSPSGAQAPILM